MTDRTKTMAERVTEGPTRPTRRTTLRGTPRATNNPSATPWGLLGITRQELHVYETLLATGACTVSALARRSGLDQRSVYDSIERLLHKGLVGEIQTGSKRTFLALNPSLLTQMLAEERASVERKFLALEALARQGAQELSLHLIPDKKSFFALIRRTTGARDIHLGNGCERVVENPNWKFFILHNRATARAPDPERCSASIIAIFTTERFLLYSVADEKGFFVDDAAFAESMKGYFDG